MIVHIPGHGSVTLTQADYVGGGGEGNVYVKGNRAYKLYHDPARMIALGKIQDLSVITDARVIKPEQILCDAKGTPLGYNMRYVKDAWALCQTFTKAFRDREGLTHDKMLKLIRRMQEGVQNVHKVGILLVDLNEMNFLVGKAFDEVFFIDADSYQTPHFKSTAIMESVRDPKHDYSKGLGSVEADWFSFACVSFQMFTGIHPFKGRHPTIKGLSDRMQAGVSVFHRDVSVPPVVYPFSVLPPAYRAWYEALFVDGKRLPPPTDLTGVIVVTPQVLRTLATSGGVDITDLHTMSADVLGLYESFGKMVILTLDGIFVDRHRVADTTPGALAVFTPKSNTPVIAAQDGHTLSLVECDTKREIPFGLNAQQMMATRGRLYIKSGGQVFQVRFTEVGNKVLASAEPASNCMEHATALYEGVAVQSMLGVPYVTLFPTTEDSYTIKVDELTPYKVVEAKADGNVMMVIGARRDGKYDRLIFRFEDFTSYDVRKVEDITPSGLNFVVLENGVAACLTEEDKLELFSGRKGSATLKMVEDKALGGDMRLGKAGGKVVFWRGNKVCRIQSK